MRVREPTWRFGEVSLPYERTQSEWDNLIVRDSGSSPINGKIQLDTDTVLPSGYSLCPGLGRDPVDGLDYIVQPLDVTLDGGVGDLPGVVVWLDARDLTNEDGGLFSDAPAEGSVVSEWVNKAPTNVGPVSVGATTVLFERVPSRNAVLQDSSIRSIRMANTSESA